MAAESVGRIGLDLVVNQNGFHKQMKGISSLAKKAGATLAAAFAVKKIVDFGKEAIELGSNLNEVQNVVDVTFTKMSEKVNEFAKNAADSFGLSETMAKRYTGTFGAMAKAFGFTESAAYDMSTTLTGLAGDVASFYNIRQDEAYTKLKSVFTGETESLKELGVVMTQTALDQFALANGFGKTTAKMSEAEKVSLRYAFVQKQLATASGDFARTSDSWANQTRILSLRFESLKATLGQGFINLFTPIVKVINTLLVKLQSLAQGFKSFTDSLMGTSSKGGNSVSNIAVDAENAASSVGGISDAAKDAKKALGAMSIDELNIVQDTPEETSGSGGVNIADSLAGVGSEITAEVETPTTKALNRIKGLVIDIKDSFVNGFLESVKSADFSGLQSSISSIGDSLQYIFSDEDIQLAASNFITSYASYLGTQAGAFITIGANILSNITQGISEYLDGNGEFISGKIASIFNNVTEYITLSESISLFLVELSEIFLGESALSITENLIALFSNGILNITDLITKFGADFIDMLSAPILENKDKLKEAIENTLSPISTIFGTIRSSAEQIWSKIFEVYEKYVSPSFERFKEGLTEIVGKLIDAYNTYIAPVLQNLADKFSSVFRDHVVPAIQTGIEFVGKIMECISTFWNEVLAPLVSWLIDKLAPVISEIIDTAGTLFADLWTVITDVFSGIMETLGGFVDFLTGLFSGDMTKALKGIQGIFTGIWNTIKSLVSGIFTGMCNFLTNTIEVAKSVFSNVLSSIKNIFIRIFTSIKNTICGIFEGMWNGIKFVINSILSGVESLANGVVRGINMVVGALNNLSFDVPDWIPGIGGKTFGFNIPTLSEINIPRLAQGGYVKANTPQLAMIGDNRHHGEIVAPENKLFEITRKAAELANGNNERLYEYLERMFAVISDLLQAVLGIEISSEISGRELLTLITNESKRAGYMMSKT